MAGRCADSALSGRERASICRGLFCLPVGAVWKGLSASPSPPAQDGPAPPAPGSMQGRWLQEPLSRAPASWQASQQLPKEEQEERLPHQHPSWEGQGHTGTDGAADSAAPGWPLPPPQRAARPGLLATVPHGPLAGCVALGVWPALRLGMAAGAGGGCQHPTQSAAEVAPQESPWVFGLLCVLSQEMAIHRGAHAVPQMPR